MVEENPRVDLKKNDDDELKVNIKLIFKSNA